MAVQQVTVNSEDGAVIGALSTDLVAFHGGTPCDQAAAAVSITTGIQVTTGCAGFTTTAQVTSVITAINAIIAALKEKGLMASS